MASSNLGASLNRAERKAWVQVLCMGGKLREQGSKSPSREWKKQAQREYPFNCCGRRGSVALGIVEGLCRIYSRIVSPRTRRGFVHFVSLLLSLPLCPGPKLSKLSWAGLVRGLGQQSRDQGEHWRWAWSAHTGLSTGAAAEMTSGPRSSGRDTLPVGAERWLEAWCSWYSQDPPFLSLYCQVWPQILPGTWWWQWRHLSYLPPPPLGSWPGQKTWTPPNLQRNLTNIPGPQYSLSTQTFPLACKEGSISSTLKKKKKFSLSTPLSFQRSLCFSPFLYS